MGAFIKTFFICLILCCSFLVYKFTLSEGYDPDLKTSQDSTVFGNTNKFDQIKQKDDKSKEKHEYTCWFYSNSGKLIPVKREFSAEQSLENTITMLLKGPTITESQKGIYTEIPKNVDLISLKQDNNSIIVNLTPAFGNGGGSKSVENRVKQLSKTVKSITNKKIYLHINNKEVEYLGGEGVYIKQPLE